MIVAIPFPIQASPHRRLAQFIARIRRLQSRIGSRARVFFDSRHTPRSSPKPTALAPTFRFRVWTLTGARGSNRSHSRSPQGDGLLSCLWDKESGCEKAYRFGSAAKQREKSEGATRPLDGEGPMSRRVAIRACRRAQALSAEAGRAARRLEEGAKPAQ
jgi:hypothetical protein